MDFDKVTAQDIRRTLHGEWQKRPIRQWATAGEALKAALDLGAKIVGAGLPGLEIKADKDGREYYALPALNVTMEKIVEGLPAHDRPGGIRLMDAGRAVLWWPYQKGKI